MGYLLPAKITLTWRKESVISSYAVAKPTSETINDCCNTPFLSSPSQVSFCFVPDRSDKALVICYLAMQRNEKKALCALKLQFQLTSLYRDTGILRGQ
jgi:hypothetical protein